MPVTFNGNKMLQLINELVAIPSPTGYTDDIIAHIEKMLKRMGLSTERNRKGALLAVIPGRNDDQQRLLTAHVDTLGAMVKEIKSNGRLKLSLIGGSQWPHLEGEYCQIIASNGEVYSGTILMHQTAVHVYKDSATLERNENNMEVRIDERVSNADEVRALGIEVGDFVAFAPRIEITPSGFIKARHLDDKAGVGILLYILREMQENNVVPAYTTHILISNYEEIGYGGNSNIPEQVVEYVAVDMGALGDGQTGDEFSVSICAKDSSGPYNHRLRRHFEQIARANDIAYKVDIYPYYGSDASAALRAGYDVVHGLIGPGIDASHAFERTHVDSVINTARLIYHYLLSDLA